MSVGALRGVDLLEPLPGKTTRLDGYRARCQCVYNNENAAPPPPVRTHTYQAAQRSRLDSPQTSLCPSPPGEPAALQCMPPRRPCRRRRRRSCHARPPPGPTAPPRAASPCRASTRSRHADTAALGKSSARRSTGVEFRARAARQHCQTVARQRAPLPDRQRRALVGGGSAAALENAQHELHRRARAAQLPGALQQVKRGRRVRCTQAGAVQERLVEDRQRVHVVVPAAVAGSSGTVAARRGATRSRSTRTAGRGDANAASTFHGRAGVSGIAGQVPVP